MIKREATLPDIRIAIEVLEGYLKYLPKPKGFKQRLRAGVVVTGLLLARNYLDNSIKDFDEENDGISPRAYEDTQIVLDQLMTVVDKLHQNGVLNQEQFHGLCGAHLLFDELCEEALEGFDGMVEDQKLQQRVDEEFSKIVTNENKK